MTIKQLNKQNPSKWVLVSADTKKPIYIAPQELTGCKVTDKIEEAEVWAYADTLSYKLRFFETISKLNLQWQEIKTP